MYIDWTYIILVLPAVLFSLWASRKVKTTYQQYQTQYNSRNITGAQATRFILDRNGLSNIRIEQTSGTLTDHYDPSANAYGSGFKKVKGALWNSKHACKVRFLLCGRE